MMNDVEHTMLRKVDVIIPARNESLTIGPIIDAFMATPNVGRVIVVDDQSQDHTWNVAVAHNALVTKGLGTGKGQAVMMGLDFASSDRVCLCDADLNGFTDVHAIALLTDPGSDAMVIGVPEFTPNLPWAHKIKDTDTWANCSGERCLSREILSPLNLHGYAMEVQINAAIARAGLDVIKRNLTGVKGSIKPMSYEKRTAEWLRDLEWLKANGV